MEPHKMSRNRLAAERWLDEDGSFSSEAVARAFTRRCGKRDPVDKSPCMHAFGHEGRHAWEPTQTPEHWREWGSKMTEMVGGRKRD